MELSSRTDCAYHSLLQWRSLYIFNTRYYVLIPIDVCVLYFMTPPLSLYKKDHFQKFKCLPFWWHSFFGYWEGFDPVNQLSLISWMTEVTPNDRPKSVRNRYVIKIWWHLCVVFWLLFSELYRDFGLFSRAEHSLPYSDVTIYIFAILYLSSMPYV